MPSSIVIAARAARGSPATAAAANAHTMPSRQSASAAGPDDASIPGSAVLSLQTSTPIRTTSSNTEARVTCGRQIRAAGTYLSSAMPASVGSRIVATIASEVCANEISISSRSPANACAARLTYTGTVTTGTILLTAVSATDNATSPRPRYVNIVDVDADGRAASRTSPIASAGSRRNAAATANASSGKTPNIPTSPSTTASGAAATARKSAGRKPMPTASIIIAM